jgi:hypothetical protein
MLVVVKRVAGIVLVVLALLPASALAQGTVGPGQVITDPAAETEQPPAATGGVPQAASARPARPAKPQRRHVTRAPAAAPSAPAASAPTSSARPATASTRRATLPFTGVDAGALALAGLALLAAGSGLLAVLRQPVQ